MLSSAIRHSANATFFCTGEKQDTEQNSSQETPTSDAKQATKASHISVQNQILSNSGSVSVFSPPLIFKASLGHKAERHARKRARCWLCRHGTVSCPSHRRPTSPPTLRPPGVRGFSALPKNISKNNLSNAHSLHLANLDSVYTAGRVDCMLWLVYQQGMRLFPVCLMSRTRLVDAPTPV